MISKLGLTRRCFVSMASAAVANGWFKPAPDVVSDTWNTTPSLWSDGQLFAFSGIDGATNYDFGIVARSINYPCGLSIEMPARVALTFGKLQVGACHLTSDTFRVGTEHGTTTGTFVNTTHLLIEGYCVVGDLPAGLECRTERNRTLIGAKKLFDPSLIETNMDLLVAARHAWLASHRVPPGLPTQRRQTLTKVLCVMKGQINASEGVIHHKWTTPDRWPHRDLWLWDSVFHALGWRHLDISVARETLEAVFDGQQADGRIPHQLSPRKASAVTQPPVLAFGVEQLAGSPIDLEWIGRCYPRLRRYLDWDFQNRMGSDKLAHWFIDPDPLSRSGESGMDNSPRFDSAAQLFAVDFNSFLSLECAVMARFAAALGLQDDARLWRDRRDRLNAAIQELLWNEKAGFYFDFDPLKNAQTKVSAISGFLPLICGACTPQQVFRLIAQMGDPKTFGTKFGLPSTASPADSANMHDMWRGPVWINTNWLVAYGLDQYGHGATAKQLREQTMREVERWYLQAGCISEFYDQFGTTPPEMLPRKGRFEIMSPYHQAIHDYGWTATLYADLVYSSLK